MLDRNSSSFSYDSFSHDKETDEFPPLQGRGKWTHFRPLLITRNGGAAGMRGGETRLRRAQPGAALARAADGAQDVGGVTAAAPAEEEPVAQEVAAALLRCHPVDVAQVRYCNLQRYCNGTAA